MTPSEALHAGELETAIRLQRHATDAIGRLALAELLGVAGAYVEALEVLAAVNSPDAHWPATRQSFARVLRAAGRRQAGRRTRFVESEPLHLRHRWRAYRLQPTEPELAARHVDRADSLAPELAGHADGREFLGLRDADDLFGSVLEFVARGRWAWVAWESLARVRLAAETGTLDIAFRPATLTFRDGQELGVALPLIYPHSGETDGAFRCGLETDFDAAPGGPTLGIGARLLQLGDDEVPLGLLRRIDIRPVG